MNEIDTAHMPTITLQPCKGAIGICQHGFVGLLISKTPDGAWSGIHLTESKAGKPWQSKNPIIIGYGSSLPRVFCAYEEKRVPDMVYQHMLEELEAHRKDLDEWQSKFVRDLMVLWVKRGCHFVLTPSQRSKIEELHSKFC